MLRNIREIPNPLEVGAEIERAAADVAPLFRHNDWKWSRDEDCHVPDRDELSATLRRLVTNLYAEDALWTGSGRLTARREPSDPGYERLTISLDLGEVEYEVFDGDSD